MLWKPDRRKNKFLLLLQESKGMMVGLYEHNKTETSCIIVIDHRVDDDGWNKTNQKRIGREELFKYFHASSTTLHIFLKIVAHPHLEFCSSRNTKKVISFFFFSSLALDTTVSNTSWWKYCTTYSNFFGK